MAGTCIHLAQINALCHGNGLQLMAQTIADGFHVGTALVTANARAQNGLRQIVADIQAELAPDFFLNIRGNAGMNARTGKQCFHRLHALAFQRCGKLAIDNADGGFGVEVVAVGFLVGGHLDEGGQNMFRTDFGGDDFLTVHTVHQAHHGGVGANGSGNAVQCAGQRTVFQRNHQ